MRMVAAPSQFLLRILSYCGADRNAAKLRAAALMVHSQVTFSSREGPHTEGLLI
jgi:hypothetical protein